MQYFFRHTRAQCSIVSNVAVIARKQIKMAWSNCLIYCKHDRYHRNESLFGRRLTKEDDFILNKVRIIEILVILCCFFGGRLIEKVLTVFVEIYFNSWQIMDYRQIMEDIQSLATTAWKFMHSSSNGIAPAPIRKPVKAQNAKSTNRVSELVNTRCLS